MGKKKKKQRVHSENLVASAETSADTEIKTDNEVTELPQIDTKAYCIRSPKNFHLRDIACNDDGKLGAKKIGKAVLANNQAAMFGLQERLYAENKQSLLIIFQAMDAAGKDGAIKHVMSGLNPQGTHVTSFKAPSSEELDRDYLWRINRALPRRGEIGIFNRSHYEEVIITQLHNLLDGQQIPADLISKDVWLERYKQINNWEEYLTKQGYVILKFFLHLSKEEQRERLLARIIETDKNWKFSAGDIAEREHWDEYQELYEEMIQNTSTPHAPWYVVPADKKWFSRALASQVVADTLAKMNPVIPELDPEAREALDHWREVLEQQDPEKASEPGTTEKALEE